MLITFQKLKMGVTSFVFEIRAAKPKIWGVPVAMVTFLHKKMAESFSEIIGVNIAVK